MNIAENIFISDFAISSSLKYIKHRDLVEESKKLVNDLGLDIDPKVKVGNLSYAERTIVEIAKALSKKAQNLIFDEPTSSLIEKEKENLFRIICKEVVLSFSQQNYKSKGGGYIKSRSIFNYKTQICYYNT